MSSRRNYVTAAEVLALAGFTPSDVQINEAEEIIDAYVGPQPKHVQVTLTGKATAGGNNTISLQQEHIDLQIEADYYKYCEVEIIGGTGAGQRKTVLSNTKAGVLTVDSNWDTAPDNTSFYKIYQLGKFPRIKDVTYFTDSEPYQYLKSIPEAIKRATAAQCEYMYTMGDDFFASDKANKSSERIGDYSYTNAEGPGAVTGVSRHIAPKAKLLLRGIINRRGEMV